MGLFSLGSKTFGGGRAPSLPTEQPRYHLPIFGASKMADSKMQEEREMGSLLLQISQQ